MVDGVDSMVVPAGSVRSLRDEVKLMFRGAGERIKLFYQIAGYREVKEVINGFLEEVIANTVASGEFAGVILRVTEPCFYDKALQIMLISSDKKRAKESNCSLDEIKRRDRQTNMDSFNPKRYPVKISEIRTVGITHYKGYRKALRAVIIYSISYILRSIFRWNVEAKQSIVEKVDENSRTTDALSEMAKLSHPLITLKNYVSTKKVVKLLLIRALLLDKALKPKAAESLNRWLVFDGEYRSVHDIDIRNYIRYLKGETEEPGELYLALSVDGDAIEVEGWTDLKVTLRNTDGTIVNEYAVMEIAPWNRNNDRDARRFVNLAPEIRAFGLRRVLAENPDPQSRVLRSKVTTLGERDVMQHVFAEGMETWFVQEYIEKCARNAEEIEARYGDNNVDQGSDGFVFKQWQRDPKVLVEGPYGKVAAVGRPSGERTAEINAKLNSVRRKILEQGFFRDDEIDSLEVRVLENAYKSATFKISGPAKARKTTLEIDHRTFNNEDFLYIVIKHELTDLRLKAIMPELNPALRELYTIITVNIAEFLCLRDQHIHRAKALVAEYAQTASYNNGLYRRYAAILNDKSLNDQFAFVADISRLISTESVYFDSVRDHMKEFGADGSAMAVTMLRIHIRMVEKAFSDSKEMTGPEDLKPLTSLQGTRSIPSALVPFMPYAEAISFKEVEGMIFLKIRITGEGNKERYVHVLLAPKDNIEATLGRGGHLFGLTYDGWRKQLNQHYSDNRFEDENSDGVFSFPREGIIKERKAFYNMIIREPLTRLINRINEFNLRHSSRDISEELKNKFKDLFKLMGEKATVSKFTLIGLIGKDAKSHKLYWHIWNRYVLDYINKLYPKLFLGEVDVRAKPVKDLPVWPVTESAQMTSSLVSWMTVNRRRGPPSLYLEAKRMSISGILGNLSKAAAQRTSRSARNISGSDGFVFDQYNEEPETMFEGQYGNVKIAGGRPAEEAAEINAKLNEARRKLLEEGFFRKEEIDNLQVRVLSLSRRSATFTISGKGASQTITLDIDSRTFINDDFLYIAIKHELTDLRLIKVYPILNPALREMYSLINVNIAEFLKLREVSFERAKALVEQYAPLASQEVGLLKRYTDALGSPALIHSQEVMLDIYRMLAHENVYPQEIRASLAKVVKDGSSATAVILSGSLNGISRYLEASYESQVQRAELCAQARIDLRCRLVSLFRESPRRFDPSVSMTITHVGDQSILYALMQEQIKLLFMDLEAVAKRFILYSRSVGSYFSRLIESSENKEKFTLGENVFDAYAIHGTLEPKIKEGLKGTGDIIVLTGTEIVVCVQFTFYELLKLKRQEGKRTVFFIPTGATSLYGSNGSSFEHAYESYISELESAAQQGYEVYDFIRGSVVRESAGIPEVVVVWVHNTEEVKQWLDVIGSYKTAIAPDDTENTVVLNSSTFRDGNSFVKKIVMLIAGSIAFFSDRVQAAVLEVNNGVEAPKEGMFDNSGVWIIAAALIAGLLIWIIKKNINAAKENKEGSLTEKLFGKEFIVLLNKATDPLNWIISLFVNVIIEFIKYAYEPAHIVVHYILHISTGELTVWIFHLLFGILILVSIETLIQRRLVSSTLSRARQTVDKVRNEFIKVIISIKKKLEDRYLLDRAIKRGVVEIEDEPLPFGMKRARLLGLLVKKGFVYSHQFISDDAQIWRKSHISGNRPVQHIVMVIAGSVVFFGGKAQAAVDAAKNVVEVPEEGMFDGSGIWMIAAVVITGLLIWLVKKNVKAAKDNKKRDLIIETTEVETGTGLTLNIRLEGSMDNLTSQEFAAIIPGVIKKSGKYAAVVVDLSLLNSFNTIGAACLIQLIKALNGKLRIIGLENEKVRVILELNKLKIETDENDDLLTINRPVVQKRHDVEIEEGAIKELLDLKGEAKISKLEELRAILRKLEIRKRRLFLKDDVPASLEANRQYWIAFYERMIIVIDLKIRILTGWKDKVDIGKDMEAFEQEQLGLNVHKAFWPKGKKGVVSLETLFGIAAVGVISVGGVKLIGAILASGALGILLVWAYRKWFAKKVSAHNDIKRNNRQTYFKVIKEIKDWNSDNSSRMTDDQYITDLESFARRLISENKIYALPIRSRLIITLNLFDPKRFETVHYGIIAIWKALTSKDNPYKLDTQSEVSFISPQAYNVLSNKLSGYETNYSMRENRLIRFAVNVVLFDFIDQGEQRLAELMWLREEMGKELRAPGTSKLQQITVLQDLHGGFRRAAALIGHALGLGVDAYRHIHTLDDLKMSLAARGINIDNQNIRFVGLNDKYDRGNDPRGIFNLVKWLRDTGKAKVFSANHDTARALGCLGVQFIKGINMEAKHGVGYFAKDAIEHAGWTTIEFDRINEHYLNSEINRVNIVLRQYGLPGLLPVDITSYRTSIEPEMKRIKKVNAKIRHENELGKDDKGYTRQVELPLPDIFTQTLGFIREKKEEYNRRINAINDENGIDIEPIQFVEVTLDNYMENPEVKERTLWELQNFRLFYIDILGNLHIHALPPIDFTTRTVNVHYKGYNGLKAFEMIQEDIRSYFEGMRTIPNSESFRNRMWEDLGEAFTIVMEWFSDVDAHIKPVSVIKFMEHGGPQAFNEGLIGARARQFSNRQASFMMIVGHNERKKFNDPETPLPWIVLSPETGSGLMNIDYELAEGYSDRGAYVSFFKRDESGKITGLRQWGFPEADKAKGQTQQEVVAVTDITMTDTEGLNEDQLEFLKNLSDGEYFMQWYGHKALVEMSELLQVLIERAQIKGRQEKVRNFTALSKYFEAQIQKELMRKRTRSKAFYPHAVPARIAKRTRTKNVNVQFVFEGSQYVLVKNKKGQYQALVDRLNELATTISRRGSPALALQLEQLLERTGFVVTTKKRYLEDENTYAVMVASCNIEENKVYLHPHFFNLPREIQSRIIYHEVISHILKGNFSEKEAMKDTLIWFEDGAKVQYQRFGFTEENWKRIERALSKISEFRQRGFDYRRLWLKARALLLYKGEGNEFIRNSVLEYIFRMAKFVQEGARKNGSVLGLAGEISGLYEIIIKRNTTMKEIKLGTLESVNEVVDDGSGGVKEFDAVSSNTVFEFKFHLSLNKLYQQVIGVDSIRLPHLKVLTDNPKFQHIRNIVYFGESDNGNVIKAVQLFIENRPELHSRVFVSGTNGISIRLTLEETRDFLMAATTIALLRQEENGHRGRYLPGDFEINNAVMMSLIDKKIEQLAGAKFDVIISVSNVNPARVEKIRKIVGTKRIVGMSTQKQWLGRQEVLEEEDEFDAIGRGRDFVRERSSVTRDQRSKRNMKNGGFALTEVLAGISAVGLIIIGGIKVVGILAAGALGILLVWAFRRWISRKSPLLRNLPFNRNEIIARFIGEEKVKYAEVSKGDDSRGYELSIKRLGSESNINGILKDSFIKTEEDLRSLIRIIVFGKGGVLRFWNKWGSEKKQALLDQIRTIDVLTVEGLYQELIVGEQKPVIKITDQTELPELIDRTKADADEHQKAKLTNAKEKGSEAYRKGNLAVLDLAGGNANRFKYPHPKGMFPIGQNFVVLKDNGDNISKNLFQLRAEMIKAQKAQYGRPIPWIIMTSEVNDKKTKEFFKENDYFGLAYDENNQARSEIYFIAQRVLPVVTDEGEFILQENGLISVGGVGHGDARDYVLRDKDVLNWLRSFGIEYIAVMQIDNALAMPDETFLGLHIQSADNVPEGWEHFSALTVEKAGPREKMGPIVQNRSDDEHSVITVMEYNQVPEDQMHLPFIYIVDNGQRVVFVEADRGDIRVLSQEEAKEWLMDELKTIDRLGANERKAALLAISNKLKGLDELPEKLRSEYGSRAKLWLRLANINFHIWTLDTIAGQSPLRVYVDRGKQEKGFVSSDKLEVVARNKFESLVFDGELRSGAIVMEAREKCFAPVKQSMFEHVDSPHRAKQVRAKRHTSYLKANGWGIDEGETIVIEHIDLDKDDHNKEEHLRSRRFRILSTGEYLVLTAHGFKRSREPRGLVVQYSAAYGEFLFVDADDSGIQAATCSTLLELDGKKYIFTADPETGKVCLTTKPNIELSAALVREDGIWAAEKIGKNGSVEEGAFLYLSGNRTRIGEGLRVKVNAKFLVIVEDEYVPSKAQDPKIVVGNGVKVEPGVNVKIIVEGTGRLVIEDNKVFDQDVEIVVMDGEEIVIASSMESSPTLETSGSKVDFGDVEINPKKGPSLEANGMAAGFGEINVKEPVKSPALETSGSGVDFNDVAPHVEAKDISSSQLEGAKIEARGTLEDVMQYLKQNNRGSWAMHLEQAYRFAQKTSAAIAREEYRPEIILVNKFAHAAAKFGDVLVVHVGTLRSPAYAKMQLLEEFIHIARYRAGKISKYEVAVDEVFTDEVLAKTFNRFSAAEQAEFLNFVWEQRADRAGLWHIYIRTYPGSRWLKSAKFSNLLHILKTQYFASDDQIRELTRLRRRGGKLRELVFEYAVKEGVYRKGIVDILQGLIATGKLEFVHPFQDNSDAAITRMETSGSTINEGNDPENKSDHNAASNEGQASKGSSNASAGLGSPDLILEGFASYSGTISRDNSVNTVDLGWEDGTIENDVQADDLAFAREEANGYLSEIGVEHERAPPVHIVNTEEVTFGAVYLDHYTGEESYKNGVYFENAFLQSIRSLSHPEMMLARVFVNALNDQTVIKNLIAELAFALKYYQEAVETRDLESRINRLLSEAQERKALAGRDWAYKYYQEYLSYYSKTEVSQDIYEMTLINLLWSTDWDVRNGADWIISQKEFLGKVERDIVANLSSDKKTVLYILLSNFAFAMKEETILGFYYSLEKDPDANRKRRWIKNILFSASEVSAEREQAKHILDRILDTDYNLHRIDLDIDIRRACLLGGDRRTFAGKLKERLGIDMTPRNQVRSEGGLYNTLRYGLWKKGNEGKQTFTQEDPFTVNVKHSFLSKDTLPNLVLVFKTQGCAMFEVSLSDHEDVKRENVQPTVHYKYHVDPRFAEGDMQIDLVLRTEEGDREVLLETRRFKEIKKMKPRNISAEAFDYPVVKALKDKWIALFTMEAMMTRFGAWTIPVKRVTEAGLYDVLKENKLLALDKSDKNYMIWQVSSEEDLKDGLLKIKDLPQAKIDQVVKMFNRSNGLSGAMGGGLGILIGSFLRALRYNGAKYIVPLLKYRRGVVQTMKNKRYVLFEVSEQVTQEVFCE
ncbi:MAG TPA: hypothetical protein DDX37_01200, partial [Candidatus Omnitrophica bacterium]|nr:hypothetical protein [Candidatus Omnitrophota bacterium]